MADNFIVIAYDLSAFGNHAYFFDGAPDTIFCSQCGCCIDDSYLPKNLKITNKTDIGYTYDRRPIVSQRFKEFIETLPFHVDFYSVNQNNTYFLMKPRDIINYTASEKNDYCNKCHQYVEQVAPDPSFYKETGSILENGIFSTSTSFGSGLSKCPSIILGIKTAKLIMDAIKINKFRGPDISPRKCHIDYLTK